LGARNVDPESQGGAVPNSGTIIKKGSRITIKLSGDPEPIYGAVMHDYDWQLDGPIWVIEKGFYIEVHEVHIERATSIIVDGVDWLQGDASCVTDYTAAQATQLEFDFGTWSIRADAIARALDRTRSARELKIAEAADAEKAARVERRTRLERDGISAWWSDLAGELVIFDGSLKHTRDFRGHWSVGHLRSYGTEWNLAPWVLWTPVDVGSEEFAKDLDEARFHARMLASMKMMSRDLRRKVISRLGELF
jgi:hypothetical protein